MHLFLRLASITVLLMLTAAPLHAASESKPSGKILKWVDENGVTHYGDTIPPQHSGKSNITISPRGIPHVDAKLKPDNGSSKETEQSRRDRNLQSVYSSEQEIDLARDRNLQMDEAMLEGLQQRKLGASARLQSLKQNESNIKTRNKAVPEDLKKDIKDANLELGKIDEQIVERKQHMDTTRQRFENDKRRFGELKNGTEVGAELGKPDAAKNAATPASQATPPTATPKR